MNIAIVGAGVAGSYLAKQLSEKHEVTIFERDVDHIGTRCGMMTQIRKFTGYCVKSGLSPHKYILNPIRNMHVEGYRSFDVNGFIIIDKRKFLLDLIENQEIIEERFKKSEIEEYGLVIDATGASRSVLPKQKNAEKHLVAPYQLKIEIDELSKDIFVGIRGIGYLWQWNIGDNIHLVGCGSQTIDGKEEVEKFLEDKDYSVIENVSGTVKLSPPSISKPFYDQHDLTPVVGVGEAIGAISPMTGEGILPSLRSADYLLEEIMPLDDALPSSVWFKRYESKMLNRFTRSEYEYELLEGLRNFNPIKILKNLWRIREPPEPLKNSMGIIDVLIGIWCVRDNLEGIANEA